MCRQDRSISLSILALVAVVAASSISSVRSDTLQEPTQVTRWSLPSGNFPVAFAVNDSGELFIERDYLVAGGYPYGYVVERYARDKNTSPFTYAITKLDTVIDYVGQTVRIAMKGDTLITVLNYANVSGPEEALVQLSKRNGGAVNEWGTSGKKYFPGWIRGAAYSGSLVWLGIDGVYLNRTGFPGGSIA